MGASGAQLGVQRSPAGVGDLAGRVVGLGGVVDEGIEGVLLAQVLEEILLSPALEHAVGDFDVTQIPAVGDHRGLMAVVAQARNLPQAQLALEEADRLIMQVIAHPTPVEFGAAVHEAPLVDETALAFAIGQDIEALLDHGPEQLRAPAAAVEDDGRAPLADHPAHLA